MLGQGPVPESGRSIDTMAAVLFVDISGFTAMVDLITERFGDEGAERLQSLLNDCFTPLVETVDRSGGQVLAFPGDAAICLWPVHESGALEHAVVRATQCALHLRQQLDGLSSLAGIQLRIRSAVGAGAIQASMVGGLDGRWHVVVRGAAVEQLAATLKAGSAGEVVLSAEARSLCASLVQGSDREAFRLVSGVTAPPAREEVGGPNPIPSPDAAAIARLIPASLRARIDAGQQGWMSEFRIVTVLFIVIKRMPVDHRDAQQAVQLIQATLRTFDGELNQVVFDDKGFTAVAVFGLFQQSHENDGARAVGAARELRDALEAVAVDARMGVATGRVFTGVRGGASREEFAIIGSVVVLAARLAGLADDVLCDSSTQSSATTAFQFDPQTPRTLKGLGLVRGIWRPRSLRTGTADAVDSGGSATTVGRAAERMRIDAGLAGFAADAIGGALIIAGEPGIGKSALVAAARESATRHEIKYVVGAGDPIQPLTTLRAWRPIVTALIAGDRSREVDVVDRLTSLLGPEEAEWFPLLNPVLLTHLPENDSTSRLTAESRAQTMRLLLVTLLREFASRHRLLVVIEDAHWIDSSSWDLIGDVVAQVPRLMLILTSRPTAESDPRVTKLVESRFAELIALAPMTALEIRALVAARVGADDLADDLARWIEGRCEGNPLFAIEIALMLLEAGTAKVRDGRCQLVDEDARALESLPNTVRGVITVRIDRLRAEDQLTLKVASVLGRQFDVEALHAINPVSEPKDELERRVLRVVTTGLMIPPAERISTFAFSHALVQEVAYGLLTFAQRRSLHVRAAQHLEQHASTAAVALAPLLAHHWERAEVSAKAMVYLEQAGEHALLFASANPEAEEFFTRLIRLADVPGNVNAHLPRKRAQWERMLALAIVRQGRHTIALGHLERGLGLLGRSMPEGGWRGWVELLCRIGLRWAVSTDKPLLAGESANPADLEAARLYDALIQIVYMGNSSKRAAAGGVLPSAIAALRLGALGERIGPSGELSSAYSLLANLFAVVHLQRLALQYSALARRVAEQVDDQQAVFRALTIGQLPAFTFGHWSDAERNLIEGQLLGARLQNRYQTLVSGCTLAFISFHRGQLADAFTKFDEIRCAAEDGGHVLPQLWATAGMAEVRLREDRLADAIDLAEACLRVANDRKATDQNCRFQAHGVIASARARRNELEQAIAEVEPALAAAAAGASLSYAPHAGFCGVAEALLAACHAVDADQKALEARLKRWLRQMRAAAFSRPLLEPASLYFRAMWNQQHARPAAASRLLVKSIVLAERLGMPYEARLGQQALDALSRPGTGRQRGHRQQ